MMNISGILSKGARWYNSSPSPPEVSQQDSYNSRRSPQPSETLDQNSSTTPSRRQQCEQPVHRRPSSFHGCQGLPSEQKREDFRSHDSRGYAKPRPDYRDAPGAEENSQQERDGKPALQKSFREANERLKEAQYRLEEKQSELEIMWRKLEETQGKLEESQARLRMIEKSRSALSVQVQRLQSRGMASFTVTDSDLIQSAMQLRYNVRTFSVQYFARQLHQQSVDSLDDKIYEYLQSTTPGSNNYHSHLMSERSGPHVLHSLLWRLLMDEIFEQFHWALHLRETIFPAYNALKKDTNARRDKVGQRIPPTPEAQRRFQTWKATTSSLIFVSMKDSEEFDMEDLVDKQSRNFSETIFRQIKQLVQYSDDGIRDSLSHIIDSSIALDRDISRQAVNVTWQFPTPRNRLTFDPNCMEVATGEEPAQAGQYVDLVVAPALIKQGKSTGQDFGTKNMLLKTEVTCVLEELMEVMDLDEFRNDEDSCISDLEYSRQLHF